MPPPSETVRKIVHFSPVNPNYAAYCVIHTICPRNCARTHRCNRISLRCKDFRRICAFVLCHKNGLCYCNGCPPKISTPAESGRARPAKKCRSGRARPAMGLCMPGRLSSRYRSARPSGKAVKFAKNRGGLGPAAGRHSLQIRDQPQASALFSDVMLASENHSNTSV